MGFLCQKIADGGSAYVLFSFYVATMGQGVDDAIALYGCLVGGISSATRISYLKSDGDDNNDA